MHNTLQKVQQALDTLRKMTPQEWSELDNDTWQLAQDVRDCCKAVADRVDVLEMLAPIPLPEVKPLASNALACDPIIEDRPNIEPARL